MSDESHLVECENCGNKEFNTLTNSCDNCGYDKGPKSN